MPQTIFCANGCAGDKVENPITAVRESLPKKRKTRKEVEIPVAAVRKSLPKSRKSAEKVEIPVAAVRKSLPKKRKTREKGRESCSRRPEISTQKAKKRAKR